MEDIPHSLPNTTSVSSNFEALRATARAEAERLYCEGPGRGCSRTKKAKSAYLSRFQAREYTAMLQEKVKQAEADVCDLRRAAGNLGEEKRALQWEAAIMENTVLKEQLAMLTQEVGGGHDGGAVTCERNGAFNFEACCENGEEHAYSTGSAFVRAGSGTSIGAESGRSVMTEVCEGERSEGQIEENVVSEVWGTHAEQAGKEYASDEKIFSGFKLVDDLVQHHWDGHEGFLGANSDPWA